MRLRNRFPLLKNHPDLIYFDSAATALKPQEVIEAQTFYLTSVGANPHNNSFPQAQHANEILEQARQEIANFIGAQRAEEIIFNSGTTEGLNQLAFGLMDKIKEGDEILLTHLEHASNLLPWMTMARRQNAKIKMMPLTENYQIDSSRLSKVLSSRTKIVSFASTSNTIGVENDVPHLAEIIRHYAPQALIIVDAAQSVAHSPINVQQWDVDFLAFSLHKMFGPFGLGVLWGKQEHFENLTPLVYGGGMLKGVSKNLKNYYPAHLPHKLEAGTPNIMAIAAVKAAIDFVKEIGWSQIRTQEESLHNYLVEQIKKFNLFEQFDFYNLEPDTSTLIFNSKHWPAHEVATWLGYKHHIAVRAGAHCAWLTDRLLGVKASVRLSFSIYNTKKEIDQFVQVLRNISQEMPKFIFEGK